MSFLWEFHKTHWQNLDEEKFCTWLRRHQQNIATHLPTIDVECSDDAGSEDENIHLNLIQ